MKMDEDMMMLTMMKTTMAWWWMRIHIGFPQVLFTETARTTASVGSRFNTMMVMIMIMLEFGNELMMFMMTMMMLRSYHDNYDDHTLICWTFHDNAKMMTMAMTLMPIITNLRPWHVGALAWARSRSSKESPPSGTGFPSLPTCRSPWDQDIFSMEHPLPNSHPNSYMSYHWPWYQHVYNKSISNAILN